MFKYTIRVKLANSRRGATLTSKKEEDLDISTKAAQQAYLERFNVVPQVKKMFGEANVLECAVVEKTKVIVYA